MDSTLHKKYLKELNKKLIVENKEVNYNTEDMDTPNPKKKTKKTIVEPKLQKPFLKWVGGKTQIIDDIISKIPKQMNTHIYTL